MESILHAWDEFKKGKRNKLDVQQFEYALEDHLFQLHENLLYKKYSHGSYEGFYIRDPKVRLIHKATVLDRIVHHLVFQELNPIFEITFITDSFSCRKEKGTHRGIGRLRIFLRKVYQTHGQCFVLKCDVRKFFQSIDHKILFSLVARKIKDPDALWLIRNIIDSFESAGNIEIERERERE